MPGAIPSQQRFQQGKEEMKRKTKKEKKTKEELRIVSSLFAWMEKL